MQLRGRQKAAAFAAVSVLGALLITGVGFAVSPEVRAGSVGVLERAGADDALIRMAGEPDEGVRVAAGDAVVRRGAAAVPPLTRRLDASDGDDLVTAINLLGRLGPVARDAVPHLKELVWTGPDRRVRKNAAVAILQIAGDEPETTADFLRLLATVDDTGRVIAADALGRVTGREAEVVPALTRALADPHPEVRKEAAESLGGLGPAAAPAAPTLAALAADPDPSPRQAAADALKKVAPPLPARP